jgi:hypothetical protein
MSEQTNGADPAGSEGNARLASLTLVPHATDKLTLKDFKSD